MMQKLDEIVQTFILLCCVVLIGAFMVFMVGICFAAFKGFFFGA